MSLTRTAAVVQMSLLLTLSAGVLATLPSLLSAHGIPGRVPASDAEALLVLRDRGDLGAQRRHAWQLLGELSQSDHGSPRFQRWHGESELFADSSTAALGIQGFSAPPHAATAANGGNAAESADIPVISYTLYSTAAYAHIRRHGLNRIAALRRLRTEGPHDGSYPEDRAVPSFPPASMVLKSVWWPIAHDAVTALPVWDAQDNPPQPTGNGYTTWKRVVAVVPAAHPQHATRNVSFMGQSFAATPTVGLDEFYHVTVDAALAERLMAGSEARRAILLALGRPLVAGDYLLLVGANLATKEIPDWIWIAYWWSDRPTEGPFALGRSDRLPPPWRNYLMQVAFDAVQPREADGGAHICFNPWLEGRFPDGGQGGGRVSNCQACHARASFPAGDFLPVTRGGAPRGDDPAYAPGRLRTGFLWSIALHAH